METMAERNGRTFRALKFLAEGPLTATELARRMEISKGSARSALILLREKERVCVKGEQHSIGGPQKIWCLVSEVRRADQWTPVIASEYAQSERERWIAELLDKWERFMKSYWGPHGYPQSASGMPARARIQSFEDLEEEVDRYLVEAADACIDDLSDFFRTAIYYRHRLTDRWIYGHHPQEAIDGAVEVLLFKLSRRVAVP